MAAKEGGEKASVSQGSPLSETSSQTLDESLELTSSDAGVKPAPAELANVEEADGDPTKENNNVEKAEVSELSVDPSNKELNEGDVETDKRENHSENVEKGEISIFPVATDAEKTDNEAKEKGKQAKADKKDDVKDGKEEVRIIGRRARTRKNKRMRMRAAAVLAETTGASSATDNNGVEEKKVEEGASVATDANDEKEKSAGFIFMCSAKTKKDCFEYKIFGLPESKKEMVAKVYKGMKLFLYDIDLKLLYGIYEAAGPGGYNIEPKAFKSAFPSQVRFTAVNDCVPLPEERFRDAIKANYGRRNMFNCLLSAEQVKNLCKLFNNANKRSKLKRKVEDNKGEASGSARRNKRKGSAMRDRSERGWAGIHPDDRYGRDAYAHLAPPPSYLSASHLAALPPPPLPSYAYRGVDYYRREAPVEVYSRDPYGYYREPAQYRDSLYPASSSARYYDAGPPRYHY